MSLDGDGFCKIAWHVDIAPCRVRTIVCMSLWRKASHV